MAKLPFSKLGLKVNQETVTIKCGDQEIEVLQYLPLRDKYDLLMITLQKSNENGIFNKFKMDKYFYLNIVYLYTNLTFTDKQREDEDILYDKLESNGVILDVLAAIPDEEFNELYQYLIEMAEDQMTYGNSAGMVLKSFITDIPNSVESMKELIQYFDENKDQYQNVVEFAKAIGYNGFVQN